MRAQTGKFINILLCNQPGQCGPIEAAPNINSLRRLVYISQQAHRTLFLSLKLSLQSLLPYLNISALQSCPFFFLIVTFKRYRSANRSKQTKIGRPYPQRRKIRIAKKSLKKKEKRNISTYSSISYSDYPSYEVRLHLQESQENN